MELFDRITSPTPDFFNKLKKISLVLTAIAVGLIAANKTGLVELPDVISQIAVYVIVISGAVFGTAQTAKK